MTSVSARITLAPMAKDHIAYEALVDRALRSVVREALRSVEKKGLPGNHHFYLSFRTNDPGVSVPDFLKERYPEEITIVLQNRFWGLKVGDDAFEVSLSFQKLPAALVVPYAALTNFADPSVKFGLQFKGAEARENAPPRAVAPATPAPPAAEKPDGESQVVSLDRFRKK